MSKPSSLTRPTLGPEKGSDVPEQEQGREPDEGGQVSEVSAMDEQATPISPHDATAGDPSDESGDAQEGTAGTDAPPNDGRPM